MKSSSSLSQPPASETSAVVPSSHRRPENTLEHFLLAASALTMASVKSASRCIVSSSSTAMTSNSLERMMSHPMIPAEPEGNQTKHTKQKHYSPGKRKSLTLDENDRVFTHLLRDEPKSHPHHGTERPWASCLSSFHLELQTVVVVWNPDV